VASKLFARAFVLNVGIPNNPSQSIKVDFTEKNAHGLDVGGLDVEFQVEKTLKPEPNTCDVRIYNLSKTNQQQMGAAQKLTVRLEAGYQGATSQLYFGEVRQAWTTREGPDWITHLESGDSEKAQATARINHTFGPKVPTSTALQQIVQALGLGQGNLSVALGALASKGVVSINGAALTGNAARRMTDFCRSAQLEWSVQDGAVQILDLGKVKNQTATLVDADHGMIESPSVDSAGIVSASMLINPGIFPGALVKFDSLFVKGGYRVQRCKWTGQTWGTEWKVDFQAKKY